MIDFNIIPINVNKILNSSHPFYTVSYSVNMPGIVYDYTILENMWYITQTGYQWEIDSFTDEQLVLKDVDDFNKSKIDYFTNALPYTYFDTISNVTENSTGYLIDINSLPDLSALKVYFDQYYGNKMSYTVIFEAYARFQRMSSGGTYFNFSGTSDYQIVMYSGDTWKVSDKLIIPGSFIFNPTTGFLQYYTNESGVYDIPIFGNLSGMTNVNENDILIYKDGYWINTGATSILSGGTISDVYYTNSTQTPTTIGGILSGSSFSAQTMQQMFDLLLYPELFPSLTSPSVSISLTVLSNYEVGVSIPELSFNVNFNRGLISPAYGTTGFRSGLPISYNYVGSGLTSYSNTGLTDSRKIYDYIVLPGSNNWYCNVSYSQGEQPLSSKGNNYNTPLSSGSINTINRGFVGVYPFLYGMSENILSESTLYNTLSLQGKIISVQGNKNVTLNDELKYIYFAYPATYSDLKTTGGIIDQNGFDVTQSFTKYVYNVNSYDLTNNWTTSYKIYRSNDPTSVLNGTYQFKFT